MRHRKADSGTQNEKLEKLGPSDTYHLTDGEWVPIGAFRHHVCCGCGMEHRVETRHEQALRWIVDQPHSPNDPRPQANWWDLYRAAQWGLGIIDNPPAATGSSEQRKNP